MRILVAEDDPISLYVLETMLKRWGYELVVTRNGREAWEALSKPDGPQLAILDWMMPDMDGVQVCRKVRAAEPAKSIYIMLLTAKGEKGDVVAGLEAGADDYVTKPFVREELRARVMVGARMLELQNKLADRVRELQEAISQVKQLEGILPICSHCKKVRNDENYWQQVESYVSAHSRAQFSHSICPDCFENIVNVELKTWPKKGRSDVASVKARQDLSGDESI